MVTRLPTIKLKKKKKTLAQRKLEAQRKARELRAEKERKIKPVKPEKKKEPRVREPIRLEPPKKKPGLFAPLKKKFPEERIAAEPLPIGPPTGLIKGVPKIAKAAKTLFKGKDITKIVGRERQLQKIMKQFKINRGAAEVIAKKVETSTPKQILNVLTSRPAKLWTAGVLTGSGIVAWLASDNVLTGTTFTMRKLRDSVVDETTREEALEETEEVQSWIDTATTFVNVATRINPLLWPFRHIFMVNARKAQVDFDLEVMLIETKMTAAEEAEAFWRESAAARKKVAEEVPEEEPAPEEEPPAEEPLPEGKPPIKLG